MKQLKQQQIYSHVVGPRKGGLFVDYDDSIPQQPIQDRKRRKSIPSPSQEWRTDKRYMHLVNSGKDLTAAERKEVERTLMNIGVRISIADANSLKIG